MQMQNLKLSFIVIVINYCVWIVFSKVAEENVLGTIFKHFLKIVCFWHFSKLWGFFTTTDRIFYRKTDNGFVFKAPKHLDPLNFIPIGRGHLPIYHSIRALHLNLPTINTKWCACYNYAYWEFLMEPRPDYGNLEKPLALKFDFWIPR
jgi:hypothetical protein